MAVLPILLAPHPLLKAVAQPVDQISEELAGLAQDMLETMYAAPGIGLAANQVGRGVRLVVMDCERDREAPRRPYILFNPEIQWMSKETNTREEGCLSIPEQYAEVTRPAQVTVTYLNENGEVQEHTFTQLEATCIQHEIDHLNGVLFWDYISPLKRNMIKRKLAKLKKDRERTDHQDTDSSPCA